MYMSCTCLTIMYMLLTILFSMSLPSFLPTMYMFVQNSKKNLTCNLDIAFWWFSDDFL